MKRGVRPSAGELGDKKGIKILMCNGCKSSQVHLSLTAETKDWHKVVSVVNDYLLHTPFSFKSPATAKNCSFIHNFTSQKPGLTMTDILPEKNVLKYINECNNENANFQLLLSKIM